MLQGSNKNTKKFIAVLSLVLLLSLALWYLVTHFGSQKQNDIPPAGHIKIQGNIVCLPHKDTNGPQTLECAFGLKDDSGRYFALRDSDPGYKNITGAGTEARVEIEGEFTPQVDTKYQSIGVIEITTLTEIIADDFKPQTLPDDVDPEQIRSRYAVNGNMYAFAMQNNLNFHVPALADKTVSWHGVIRSKDNGQSWEKFFTITDPIDVETNTRVKYNPVGGFMENSKLYIDIANDRGVGSGEGQLVRFWTANDGQTWTQEDCYYFIPERYYPDYGLGKTDVLSPHDLEKSDGCIY